MRTIQRPINFISEWSGRVVSVLWIVVVLVVSYEVAAREFGAPLLLWIWCHETALFTTGSLYMLGGAYTLYRRKHISMDIFYTRCSQRGRAILDLISFPVFLLFIGALLWVGVDHAWEATIIGKTSGTYWNPPIWPVMWMIPVGAFLVILTGLAKFFDDLAIVIQRKNPE